LPSTYSRITTFADNRNRIHFVVVVFQIEQPSNGPLIAPCARAVQNEFHIINDATDFACSTAIGTNIFRH